MKRYNEVKKNKKELAKLAKAAGKSESEYLKGLKDKIDAKKAKAKGKKD